VSEHDQIQELLAGYALGALSGADAAAAERALDDHVPDCRDCRRTLDAFDAVVADLALATPAEAPPDLLLARLHRELTPRRRPAGSWNAGRIVAVAASVVLVVGAAGLAFTRGGGIGTTELVATDLQAAVAAAQQPDAETREMGEATEVTVQDGFYLYGEDVPMPAAGQVYRLWLWADGEAHYVGEFLPDATGTVAIQVKVDGSFDDAVVTVEPIGTEPSTPGSPAWQTAAPSAAA
jgi:anti-sigma-K factor RskA